MNWGQNGSRYLRKYRKELGPNMETKQTFIMKKGLGIVIPVSIAL